MLKTIEGIVLRTQDYGETHKIITIYSKELGKISAICRGANKAKSKLTSLAQPFVKANFLIYLSKGLSTVQQGEILDSFRLIREDIVKTAYAAYLVELTMLLSEDKERDLYLYNQLDFTLKWINEESELMVPVFMLELKLFKRGGFAPVINRCARCGNENDLTSFSVKEGGLLCATCFNTDDYAIQLSPNVIKLLSVFMNAGLEQIGTINMKKENIQLLRKIFDNYYDIYGSYRLKSKRFLEQINRLERQ